MRRELDEAEKKYNDYKEILDLINITSVHKPFTLHD